MAFNILYNEGPLDVFSTASYIDGVAEEMGVTLELDTNALLSVVGNLNNEEFPHVEGCNNASPFKKAAYFFVNFITAKPVTTGLPASIVGPEIAAIGNHQNVVMAYLLAIDSLYQAKIYRKTGETITLDNKIKVSKHFFVDLVEAYSATVPAYHFKITSLLFEQLTYKANPAAAYTESI